jgi:hypothetical protein
MNAPIRAAMIGGTDNTPNTMTPRGNRLPGPGEMSIQTNCPTIGSTPHLHERTGSKNANAIETKQTAGIPTEKYKPESQASFRPDASSIRIQNRSTANSRREIQPMFPLHYLLLIRNLAQSMVPE